MFCSWQFFHSFHVGNVLRLKKKKLHMFLQIFRMQWRDSWRTTYWCSELRAACSTSCQLLVFIPFCLSTSRANFVYRLIMQTWFQVIIVNEHANKVWKPRIVLVISNDKRREGWVLGTGYEHHSRKIDRATSQNFATGYPPRLRCKVDNLT